MTTQYKKWRNGTKCDNKYLEVIKTLKSVEKMLNYDKERY
jgi:hypothetical protein